MKTAALAAVPLVLVLFSGLARLSWVARMEARFEADARALGAEVGADILEGRPIGERAFRKFFASQQGRVGYVAAADFRTGYRSGVIDSAVLEFAAREINLFRKERGDARTLAHLVQPGKGFPGEYLDVVSVAFVPSREFGDRTPMGILKVGYLLPGHPFGRGYAALWWALFGLSVLVAAAGGGWAWARRGSATIRAPAPPEEEERQSLGWLEHQLDAEGRIEVDDLGRSWRLLFDGESLTGWRSRGNWYVSDGELVGQPWGASIVHEQVDAGRPYAYQVSARKISGADGLVLLFRCGGETLAWVLGGWANTRSEVGGYPSTRSPTTVPTGEWIDLEVAVGSETLEGFVNHRKVWELSRKDVVRSSPETGFEHGLGVAVWNTLVRFRTIRITAP